MSKNKSKTQKIPFIQLQKPLVKLLGSEQAKKDLRKYCIDNNISTDTLDD